MALDEDELGELYAAPLDRFVAERTALAKRLRAEGRREDAAEVRGLAKPSAPLWAVNRLASERADEIRALADAAARLTGGDAGADADLRRALRALAQAAPDALAAAGRKATRSAVDEVVALLRAAAADPETRERLVEARVREEPEPAGFAAMAGAAPPATPARREAPRRDDRARREREQRLAQAQAEVSEARANARDLRSRAETAEREAKRARDAADRADAELEEAEAKLARARSAG